MKIIEVVANENYLDSIKHIAEQNETPDFWIVPGEEGGRRVVRILVMPEQRQAVLDAPQGMLKDSPSARVVVIPVEATLPRMEETKEETKSAPTAETTREELYNSIEKNARLNRTYLLLVFLSTVVVAIGLLEDNVAAVIGAMVIAPLLGPNLALALGTALGDTDLMWKAFKTGAAGMAVWWTGRDGALFVGLRSVRPGLFVSSWRLGSTCTKAAGLDVNSARSTLPRSTTTAKRW